VYGDGVVTESNGLIYMRARYYSPEMRRFINADIIPGEISNAITLNRFAYANVNPVSNVDPFGLEAERGNRDKNYFDMRNIEVWKGLNENFYDFISWEDMLKLKIEKTNIDAYKKYEDIILKALRKTKESICSYHKSNRDFYNMEESFNDAYLKIIDAMYNLDNPEGFINEMKVKIEINPNYNTSRDEFLGEFLGFIPVLGEIQAFVDYQSNEDRDFSKMFDIISSAITENDISKLTPIAKQLNIMGYIFDGLGAINMIETIENWHSPNKLATEITIYAQIGGKVAYEYTAVVDNELMFKEMWSSDTVLKQKRESFYLTY